jgi:transposase
VKENLPQASIVFDKFHAVKLMNDRLDQLRRKVFKMCGGEKWELMETHCRDGIHPSHEA